MTTLLFVHGWSFDAQVWGGVIARLDGFDCATVDLGFRGVHRIPVVQRPLVIGHSMGLAWALAHLPRPWVGAVAVNAFPRFTRAEDFPDGVPPHRLARMREQFAEDPAAVVTGFLAKLGVAEPNATGIRPGPLGEALAWLAECDQRRELAELGCPLLALAGGEDPLVTPAMSRAGFAGTQTTTGFSGKRTTTGSAGLDMLADGGHLLPVTHPEWVAARIRAFAAGLS